MAAASRSTGQRASYQGSRIMTRHASICVLLMLSIEKIRRDWFTDVRSNVLSGIVVALALIPEAIGFSIVAGVDPRVGLYASVVIAIVISFAGGRPAMISAATAATAVLFGALVRDHGLQYLLLVIGPCHLASPLTGTGARDLECRLAAWAPDLLVARAPWRYAVRELVLTQTRILLSLRSGR